MDYNLGWNKKIKLKDHTSDRFLMCIVYTVLVIFFVSLYKLNLNFSRIINGFSRLSEVLIEFTKVDFSVAPHVLVAVWESFEIGFLATIVGVIVGLPLAFLTADNTAPNKHLANIIKVYISVIRAVPNLIWAVIYVSAIGLGPFSGVMGLSAHTIAYLTKAYMQCIEDIGDESIHALKCVGASWINIMKLAVVPKTKRALTAWTILRLETNIASSSVVGIVGAGGLGYILSNYIRRYDYSSAGTALLTLIILSLLIEFFSGRIKEKIHAM